MLKRREFLKGIGGAALILSNPNALLADRLCNKTLKKEAIPEGRILTTGYKDIDNLIGGIGAGEFAIIAGRASIMKSPFLIDIVRHVALDLQKPVVIFSPNTPKECILLRILNQEADNVLDNIPRDQMNKHDWTALTHFVRRLSDAHIFVNDKPDIMAENIHEELMKFCKINKFKPELIAIAYINSLKTQHACDNEEGIKMIASSLGRLKTKTNIPILGILSLGGMETYTMPSLESKRLKHFEPYADKIILIHTPIQIVYSCDNFENKNIPIDLIVAKNKNGQTGSVKLSYRAVPSFVARYL